MSRAFCLVCQAARGSFSTASIHTKYILFNCICINFDGNTNNGKVCHIKIEYYIIPHNQELVNSFTKIFSKVAKKPSANEAKGLNFAILNTRSIKYFPILPHRKVVHLLHGIGAIVIEPSGDDGAESVDEEGGFIVAGRVIGYCLKVCAELLGIVFDGVKEPREVIGIGARVDACIREHLHKYLFNFGFHIRSSLHKLVGQTDDFGCELLALCLYDSVIDGIGKTCKNTADNTDNNAYHHCHISV